MPHTKKSLQSVHHLTIDEVNQTLEACGLPINSQEYSEIEIQLGFNAIRSYFTDGLASDYQRAAELFAQAKQREQQVSTQVETQSENKSVNQPLSLSELLATAAKQGGARISLVEAAKILQVCKLQDKEEYDQAECTRFLEACTLLKQARERLVADNVSAAAATSEDSLIDLIEVITDKRAENIPGLVNLMYLQKVAQKLVESQEDIKSFYAGLELRILEQIEGKSRLRSIMAAEWETISLPPSFKEVIHSPNESENTANEE